MPSIINFPGAILNTSLDQISILALEVTVDDIATTKLQWPGPGWAHFKGQTIFHTIEVSTGTYWLFVVVFGAGSFQKKHHAGVSIHPDDDPDYTVTVTSGNSQPSPPASPTSTVVYTDPNGPSILPLL